MKSVTLSNNVSVGTGSLPVLTNSVNRCRCVNDRTDVN